MDGRPPLPEDGAGRVPTDESRHVREILCRMYVASEAMRLGTESRFTSLVLFHRYVGQYYAVTRGMTSNNNHNNDDDGGGRCDSFDDTVGREEREHLGMVAAACLFLGSKAEEEPRRIRDVINLSHMLDFTGSSSLVSTPKKERETVVHIWEAPHPPDLNDSYWEMKERIVSTEQSILRMLQFDVAVSHPHRAVVILLDILYTTDSRLSPNTTHLNSSYESVRKGAWRRLNDALFYAPALRHSLWQLACAAIHLAMIDDNNDDGCNVNSSVPKLDAEKWWETMIGISDIQFQDAKHALQRATISLTDGT